MADGVLIGMMDKAKVIAFDVFDTLIVRPFLKPDHLFNFMERRYSAPGFAGARVAAEHKARETIHYEATYDEIYQKIEPVFQSMNGKELETELALCSPDKEMMPYWEHAVSSGKPVVLISNMYLPSEFMGRMLEKCGYSGWTRMFVSADWQVNKNDGAIYDTVAKEMGINPGEMVMIGDNRHGDHKIPLGKGIPAFRWKPLVERYAEKYPLEYRYSRKDPELSMMAGTDMVLGCDSEDYWHCIGRRFAGPLAAGFGMFVKEHDPEADRLFFCSRDGYMAMRAYEILGGEKEFRYVYSSRFLTKVLSDPDMSDRDTKEMAEEYLEHVHPGVFVTDSRKVLAEDSERYSGYLEECCGDAENILLVDSTTLNFTAQRDIQSRLCDKKVRGCYYSVIKRSGEDYDAYADRDGQRLTWNYVHFSEYFMSSDEAPPRGFRDGSVVYTEPSEFEKERISRCKALQEGMCSYLEDFRAFYGEMMPAFSSKAVDRWMDILVKREKRDRTELWNTRWPFDAAGSKYVDLIFRPRDLAVQGRFMAGALLRKL